MRSNFRSVKLNVPVLFLKLRQKRYQYIFLLQKFRNTNDNAISGTYISLKKERSSHEQT